MGTEKKPSGAPIGRTRAPRADAVRNREKLIAAARESFELEGLSVPVDEIARRAGLGAGTIHRHFPTKEALFEEIILDHVEDLVDEAVRLGDAADAGAAFAEFCVNMVERGTRNRALAEIMALAQAKPMARLSAAAARFDRALENLVRRGQESGALRTDVSMSDVQALLTGVHLATERVSGDTSMAVRLMSVICDGLLERPAR
jgi:AcrR family transcriptional regulator